MIILTTGNLLIDTNEPAQPQLPLDDVQAQTELPLEETGNPEFSWWEAPSEWGEHNPILR